MKKILVALALFTATQSTFCDQNRDELPTWTVNGTIINGPQAGYFAVTNNNRFYAAFRTQDQANQFVALVSGGMDPKAAQNTIYDQDYYRCSIQ